MCRAELAKTNRSRGASSSEGYLNLATAAGLSPVRDTSTCECSLIVLHMNRSFTEIIIDYHGPRRGQRHYGYQAYDDYY